MKRHKKRRKGETKLGQRQKQKKQKGRRLKRKGRRWVEAWARATSLQRDIPPKDTTRMPHASTGARYPRNFSLYCLLALHDYTILHYPTLRGRPLIQRIPQVLRHLIPQVLRHPGKPLLKGMLLFLPQRTSLLLRRLPEPRSELGLVLGPPFSHIGW
jgi:hypothetical protein